MGMYDRDLRTVLGEIAGPSPAPGAGAVSGIVTAMAAGLISSAAKRSPDWEEARGVSAQPGGVVIFCDSAQAEVRPRSDSEHSQSANDQPKGPLRLSTSCARVSRRLCGRPR